MCCPGGLMDDGSVYIMTGLFLFLQKRVKTMPDNYEEKMDRKEGGARC